MSFCTALLCPYATAESTIHKKNHKCLAIREIVRIFAAQVKKVYSIKVIVNSLHLTDEEAATL